MSSTSELNDQGFTRAVIIGILVGIPVLGALAFVGFELAGPDTWTAAIAWLAAWTGLWAGVFLGGTVAVWLHMRKLEHG